MIKLELSCSYSFYFQQRRVKLFEVPACRCTRTQRETCGGCGAVGWLVWTWRCLARTRGRVVQLMPVWQCQWLTQCIHFSSSSAVQSHLSQQILAGFQMRNFSSHCQAVKSKRMSKYLPNTVSPLTLELRYLFSISDHPHDISVSKTEFCLTRMEERSEKTR